MSGGFFDYQQSALLTIADSIEEVINQNDINLCYNYPPDVIEKFKETTKQLRDVEEKVRRIDLLLEGDNGVDRFRELWKRNLGEY